MSDHVGTLPLVRLALRRDRVMLPVWIAVFVVTAGGSAAATAGLYPTIESRVRAAESINRTTSLVAMYGRIYDPTSLGGIALIKMGGIGAALVAVFAAATVVRHTRAEEETGRLELLGSTVVGRLAPLNAALIVATGANLVLGSLTALALMLSGLPAAGSVAFGLAWACAGLAFAAIAAAIAQLTTAARTAVSLTAATLGAAYVIRAIGDTSSTRAWVSWLSPIGWSQQIRPFGGDRWSVVGLLIAFAAVASASAYALVARRDLGAGLFADRPGPADAPPRLRSAFGLAWRLNRGSMLGWTAGFAFIGFVFGSIASQIGGLLDSPEAARMIRLLGGEQVLTDAFLAAELGFVSVFASAFAVQAVNRLHAEEAAIHAEPLLAAGVRRTRWALSHLAIALGGSAVLLAAAGVAAGVAHALQTSDGSQVARVLGSSLIHLPATFVFAGVALAGFGLLPRFAQVGWAALVAALLLGELGPLFNFPQVLMDLSPFAHIPRMPGGAMTWTPLVLLSVVAAAFIAAGLAGFRRRDIG